MANFTVTRAKHATLAAGVVDTVTLTGSTSDTTSHFEVFNHGTTDTIWFTADGTTPAVKADNSYFAKPGTGMTVPSRKAPGMSDQIKLLCASSCDYSVTGS